MTTREADKIIVRNQLTTVHSKHFDETFAKLFIKRDRWNIYTQDGGIYDRNDLEIIFTK